MTWAQFKQTSLLGCEQCYEAFAARLGPLLERAHEGGTHHIGKVPKRALARADRREAIIGDESVRTKRLAELRSRLESAVDAERYELAAELKAELERVRQLDSAEVDPEALGSEGRSRASGDDSSGADSEGEGDHG